jgi:transposase
VSGNVSDICRRAHVGRGTFYYWKPRFDEQGYAGLEAFASRAPKEPCRTALAIVQKVIRLRREHPDWGNNQIADDLAKSNDWVWLVSPNTVKRILQQAGLWETVVTAEVRRRLLSCHLFALQNTPGSSHCKHKLVYEHTGRVSFPVLT